jgi:hypothetical protein
MAEKDKERNQRELRDLNSKGYFITEKGEDSRNLLLKRPAFPQGVVTPKKPITPYAFFVQL